MLKYPPYVIVQEVFFLKYSQELKEQIFARYRGGDTASELTEKFEVPLPTIYSWIRKWKAHSLDQNLEGYSFQTIGTVIFDMREQKRQLESLAELLSIVHESGVLQMVSYKRRIELAQSLSDRYPSSVLCAAFEITLSSLYYHKKADARRQQKKEELYRLIQEAFEASGCRFGAERIRAQLRVRGIQIGKKRIIQLMQEMKLRSSSTAPPYYIAKCNASVESHYHAKVL